MYCANVLHVHTDYFLARSPSEVSNLKGLLFCLNKNETPIHATTSQYTDTLTFSHNGGLNETHTSEVSVIFPFQRFH